MNAELILSLNKLMDELFPESEILMDSPKLAWLKANPVKTFYCEGCGEDPWMAVWEEWLNENGIPNNVECAGYGASEEEAIKDLAVNCNIKLWNEL